jgi:hypothetical protein
MSTTNGPFLRSSVAIEMAKLVHRVVLLKTKKDTTPEWFDIQYDKLSYYCSSCGAMGHLHLECDNLLICDAEGKLPYKTQLKVYDPKQKKFRSLSEAASEIAGSTSSSSSKQPQGLLNSSGGRSPTRQSSSTEKKLDDEVSPC